MNEVMLLLRRPVRVIFELALARGFSRSSKHPISGFLGRFGCQCYVDTVGTIKLDVAVDGLNLGCYVEKFFVGHDTRMICVTGRSFRSFQLRKIDAPL